MWLWSEQIYEMFTQKSVSSPMCWSAPWSLLSWNEDFSTHLLGRQLCPSRIHLPRQTRPFQAIAVKRPLNKGKKWHSTAD